MKIGVKGKIGYSEKIFRLCGVSTRPLRWFLVDLVSSAHQNDHALAKLFDERRLMLRQPGRVAACETRTSGLGNDFVDSEAQQGKPGAGDCSWLFGEVLE